MDKSNYMRAVGAFCGGAVTLPLTARVDLVIWEMGLVAVLVGLGLFLLTVKMPLQGALPDAPDNSQFPRVR